jgi:hypothetical protein
MSASTVPTVTLRGDGCLSVPVAPGMSLVWNLVWDEVQPVLTVKVEREGCREYQLAEVDSVTLPVKL